jgi:hypothetical protein
MMADILGIIFSLTLLLLCLCMAVALGRWINQVLCHRRYKRALTTARQRRWDDYPLASREAFDRTYPGVKARHDARGRNDG